MTLVWRPGYGGAAVSDPDAQAYLQAVEVADNQALEQGVQQAVNQFVIGCKADGIWSAIKACNILAGARTLNGALVPLVKQPADSAPARFGTEGGWNYNRETGLQGNGTDNYINSGRNNNADPETNHHLGVFASSIQTGLLIGGRQGIPLAVGTGGRLLALNTFRDVPSTDTGQSFGSAVAGNSTFVGTSRVNGSQYVARIGAASSTIASTSTAPISTSLFVFAQSTEGVGPQSFTTSRLAFYSIGESLDLARLDTRVTALITAIGAAIP